MIRWRWLLPLLGALALGGCGKELTAGGMGEVSAMATDEPRASQARFTRVHDHPLEQVGASVLVGAMDLAVSVALVAESGAIVPITQGAAAARIAIGASAGVPLGTEAVPAGTYPAVRLRFTEVAAQVQGLPLAGTLFTGTVVVDLGAGPLVVEVPVAVTVRPAARSTVTLHLNSGAWLSLAQLVPSVPPSARVTATAFRQAITVTVE